MTSRSILISSMALGCVLTLSACMPETKPGNERMTTDSDKQLNVVSESPSLSTDRAIRAGSTIAPATERPITVTPYSNEPTQTGSRNTPTARPYLGNPTTRPTY